MINSSGQLALAILYAVEHMQRPCPVCGGERSSGIEQYTKHYFVKCLDCGMAFASREPSSSELDAMYSSYPIRAELNTVTRIRFHQLLDEFEKYRSTGRLIDVGCGSGFFLDVASERGWEVHGTEYDQGVVDSCAARGIHMRQGPLDVRNYEPGTFDLVTSFEVLEHLVHPQEELTYFHQLLRPGGALYFTTPNYNALSRKIAGSGWTIVNYPEHLNLYTASTIGNALGRAGFRKIQLATTGVSIMRIRASLTSTQQDNTDSGNDDQLIRTSIEKNVLLKMLKNCINFLLSVTRSGDSIKVLTTRQ